MSSVGRQLAVRYFLVQAAAIASWWIALAILPGAWPLFVPADEGREVLAAFAPGDLAVVVGSAMVWWGHYRSWATPLAWAITGALLYATAYTVAGAMLGVSTALGAGLMLLVAVASIAATAALTLNPTHAGVPPRAGA